MKPIIKDSRLDRACRNAFLKWIDEASDDVLGSADDTVVWNYFNEKFVKYNGRFNQHLIGFLSIRNECEFISPEDESAFILKWG